MKRITIALSFILLSVIAEAQPSDSLPQFNNHTERTISNEKFAQLEQEVKLLRSESQQLKSEVENLKKRLPAKAKKPVVSRTSSKGAIWVEE